MDAEIPPSTPPQPTSDATFEAASKAATPLDRSQKRIRAMFDGVAPRYDLLNHLLSGGLDILWRRRAAKALAPKPGEEILDLCCGTGDQAVALTRSRARVVGADFCVPMLLRAKPKLERLARSNGQPTPGHTAPGRPAPPLAAADALQLPFADARFDGAVVSFGLRNVADLGRALAELRRVLKPGGRLIVLEFTTPVDRIVRVPFQFYFEHILPRIGQLFSPRGGAYGYLPNSVLDFPQRQGFLDHMATAGLSDLGWQELTSGVACIYRGRRPA